ncbi:MAG: MFS transporter [Eubacteriales bacterium]|nr:MFS transporter [Eubacteriales bacterium]
MTNSWKKNTILFLTSQTISLFGSSLVQYAIMWYITLETKSGVMMTISIVCGFVPTFFLAPFAGVWADRYNRKRLIVLSDSMIALATLILAILFLVGYDMFWLLFVVSAVRALGSAVQMPTVGALIPQLVPPEKLMRINGINGSIQSLIMLVSPMAAGALMSFAEIELIFFVDVITALIAVLTLLLFVKVPTHKKALEKEKPSYFSDMAEGYKYINNHSYIKTFFLFCAVLFFLISPAAFLTPLQVARSFGSDVWRLTAIEIAFSGGMMMGGLLMASWGGFKNRMHSMLLGGFLMGVTTIVLGLTPVFGIYLLTMGLTGLAIPVFNTPATVVLQEKVEEQYMGRVFGVLGMISSSMMPMGMLLFGPLSDCIRIEWLLIVTGLLMVGETFFLWHNKTLMEAGKPSTEK